MNEDDQIEPDVVVYGGIFLGFVIAIIAICVFCSKPKPMGYGGSPGHMSPQEVQALYEKTQLEKSNAKR